MMVFCVVLHEYLISRFVIKPLWAIQWFHFMHLWLSYRLLCDGLAWVFQILFCKPAASPVTDGISLPLRLLLLDFLQPAQADILSSEDFITVRTELLASIFCLREHQRVASSSKWGPREWGLVQNSHKAKLASLVVFTSQIASGVSSQTSEWSSGCCLSVSLWPSCFCTYGWCP